MATGDRPHRVQRLRTSGWTMPPNTVYVGRPTKWGNPYRVGGRIVIEADWGDSAGLQHEFGGITLAQAVEGYRDLMALRLALPPYDDEWEPAYQGVWAHALETELAGRNLACWCPLGGPCHADVLLDLATRRYQP